MFPPVQFTVPALVMVPSTYKVPPVRLSIPLAVTVNAPGKLPPPKLRVPATVLVPPRLLPASVRLVIAPP